MKNVSSALKFLLASGLSQAEIARRSGMTQTRVHRWSKGEIPAAADDACRLIELAGIESASTQTTEGGIVTNADRDAIHDCAEARQVVGVGAQVGACEVGK